MTAATTRTESAADYRAAMAAFGTQLAALGTDERDRPSMCPGWSVRDVAGHVTWGRRLVIGLATGTPYTSRVGAPGTDDPAAALDGDPVEAWRTADEACDAALTAEALARPGPPALLAANPDATLADFLPVLTADALAHTWDVGHALGREVRLPAELLTRTRPVLERGVQRGPGMVGAEITVPDDADPQTRWLAFLGRAA